ncbi:MAG TPA: alpha-galactosidase [Candidatus Dormibacteraeota bacterium]
MKPAAARIALDAGRLDLAWDGMAAAEVLTARVELGEGSVHTSAQWRQAGDAFITDCGPLQIRLATRVRAGLAQLAVSAQATAAADVSEIGVELRPRLGQATPEWVVYNGYQSWDASGIADTSAKRQSWWTVGVALADGRGLAASARSARRHTTRFDVEAGRLLMTACEFPGLKQNPVMWRARNGQRWHTDDLVLATAPDVRDALRRAAGQVRGRRSNAVPRGWLSWYHYGPWISASEVLENSAQLAHDGLRSLGYQVVLVDDGWQQAIGDWTTNTKFPGGLPSLNAELAGRGQLLGLWTAPFLVSASADLAAQAPPGWFLKDPISGERAVDPVHVVFGPMYILDLRVAAVQRHLTETFARLRAEGVHFFKIDFLYAGAYAGTAALRAGVKAVRRGIGDDAYLLASGAPLLPMAGLCEACRIGRDTASPIFDFELGSPKPTLIGDEVVEVGRNQAARHFLDGWFQLDADVALVGGNLTPEQGRTLVTVAALSGGPFFASDHLAALDPERLGLLVNPRILDLVGGRPAVPDWQPDAKDRASNVWRRDGLVAVFNWDWQERALQVALPGPRRRVRDLWSGQDLGLAKGALEVQVPAAGARLVALEEA